MATPNDVETQISTQIVANSQGKITASVLAGVLLAIIGLFSLYGPLGGANTWTAQQTFSMAPVLPLASIPAGALQSGAAAVNLGYNPLNPVNNLCLDAVLSYGVNGTAGDGARLQSALNAAGAQGGGCVFVRPMGVPAYIDAGVSLPNGVTLIGSGTVFAGEDDTIAQQTQAGTWLQCGLDASNPCVTLSGHGSAVEGVNFSCAQTVPTTGTYTPTASPYVISAINTYFHISKVIIAPCSHGISIDPGASGGGTYSYLSDIFDGALTVGLHVDHVNDTMHIKNYHGRPNWYMDNASLVAYEETNRIDWDIHYFDNPMIDGYECFQSRHCWYFTNGTTLGNTHSMYNFQATNVDFNINTEAVGYSSASAIVRGSIANMLAQGDTGNSQTSPLIALSDASDIAIGLLSIPITGGSVATVGTGTGGALAIGTLDIGQYSAVASSQTAIVANAGAAVSIGLVKQFHKLGSAGVRMGGAGSIGPIKYSWQPYSSFGLWPTTTGTGAYQSATTTTNYYTPKIAGLVQMRLEGQIYVSTGQTSGACTLEISGFPEIITASVVATGIGWQNFDSNWIDIAEADAAAASLGVIQINCSTGVVVNNGSATVLGR